jgi:hypothetical protein
LNPLKPRPLASTTSSRESRRLNRKLEKREHLFISRYHKTISADSGFNKLFSDGINNRLVRSKELNNFFSSHMFTVIRRS